MAWTYTAEVGFYKLVYSDLICLHGIDRYNFKYDSVSDRNVKVSKCLGGCIKFVYLF